jgi:hypothetical protein
VGIERQVISQDAEVPLGLRTTWQKGWGLVLLSIQRRVMQLTYNIKSIA